LPTFSSYQKEYKSLTFVFRLHPYNATMYIGDKTKEDTQKEINSIDKDIAWVNNFNQDLIANLGGQIYVDKVFINHETMYKKFIELSLVHSFALGHNKPDPTPEMFVKYNPLEKIVLKSYLDFYTSAYGRIKANQEFANWINSKHDVLTMPELFTQRILQMSYDMYKHSLNDLSSDEHEKHHKIFNTPNHPF